MNKIRRYSSVAFTALFALAVFFFLYSHFIHHLLFLYQTPSCLQHSEWTAGSFASVSSVPGGFSNWCGCLLLHVFNGVGAIAAICAMLLTVTQILCYLTFRSRNLLLYSLSFIPAVLLWISFSNAWLPLGSIVACIFALAALYAVFRLKPAPVIRLLLVPVLYFLCGPMAFIYALAICADGLRPAELACSVTVLAACLLASRLISQKTMLQLVTGTDCCHCVAVWMTFIVSFLAAALCWVASLDWSGVRPTTSTWLGWCVAMVMAAAVPFCVGCRHDTCKDECMKHDCPAASEIEVGMDPGVTPGAAVFMKKYNV